MKSVLRGGMETFRASMSQPRAPAYDFSLVPENGAQTRLALQVGLEVVLKTHGLWEPGSCSEAWCWAVASGMH